MNILLGAGALCCGLGMAACSPTDPEPANFVPPQAAQNATAAQTPSATAAAAPRWTCTATGAGMAGTCVQR